MGKQNPDTVWRPIVASFEAEGLDPRSALKKSARQLGISRDEAYRRLTAERSREKPDAANSDRTQVKESPQEDKYDPQNHTKLH